MRSIARRTAFHLFTTAALLLSGLGYAADSPQRVSNDLLVLYRPGEAAGDVVRDASGVDAPLDLTNSRPQAVQIRDGHLLVASSTVIGSQDPATKLIDAVRAAHELSLEVWVRPNDARQAGPARIISLSSNPGERNFTLGQDGDKFDFRLRTTQTSQNGIPSTATAAGTARAGALTHVVATRNAQGDVVIWVDGQPAARGEVPGDFSNWSDDFRLLLANEATGDRPWLGELHLAAVYSRALTDDEVAHNFAAGVGSSVDYDSLLPAAVDRPVDFVADVRPLFRKHCFECHSSGNEEGGLNLGVRARVLEGGAGGPVLRAGESARSRLIHLVAGVHEGDVMPPEGDRLTDEEIGLLRAWIDQGAAWPPGADVLDPRTEQAREHWAFQPLQSIEPPDVRDASWVRTPVDRFILSALEAQGLTPAPPLDPRRLIRRMAFDIAGLPPTPDEIDEFVDAYQQDQNGAIAALVDRLLESRHYGERWGRHWLDVARYADSNGQEGDQDRPHAYHYRDFVIRAFNDDLPYDTFVRWQLAGDEYEPDNAAAVAATGFLTGGPHTVLENTFLEEERLRNRYNELDDMVATTGSAFLALTVGCARCHDHKYDAISSREYYRLLAAVHSGDRAEVQLPGSDTPALAFRDFSSVPAPTWLFERADFYDRDQPVRLGFPAVLTRNVTVDDYWSAARAATPDASSTLQRRALAEWMTDADRGAGALAARVIVNRVWQHHFGDGIVRTESDFGVRADPPTHPELLEWLAHDFVTHGWRLKRLHRMILTSSVYLQGGEFTEVHADVDPENRLLWRMRPRRLEAEILRDAMLSAAGTLNLEPYGPGFKPPIPREANVARNLKSPYPDDAVDSPETRRRSVYMFHKRLVPFPLLAAFDRPDLLQSCAARDNTTVAPQALALLNDEFVRECARDFSLRLAASTEGDRAEIVRAAFRIALGRSPMDTEWQAADEFLQAQSEQRRDRGASAEQAQAAAVADFCQALFSLNEFLYVD